MGWNKRKMIEPPSLSEARIRDELSKRLDVLEPGLALRSVEFRLPNRHGASGSIDILATDRFSATVIIEIKKSNQTARQALHELHKYVALIKSDHGLRDSQVRCILVSTEWHELLIPFSEFSRIAPWTVEGYRLFLTATGLPDSVEKVIPVASQGEMRLCPEHKVYLFRDHARRDEALPVSVKLLSEYNLPEYLLLKLDIRQRRCEGTCDFALYLIVPEFASDERERTREWLAQTNWKHGLDEPVRYLEEQLVIAEVTDALFDWCDEREIGYPEKLATICLTWDVAALTRGGPRLASKAIFSDEHLLRWAKGLEGRNAFHFEMIATPSRRLSWMEAKDNAEYCLRGNEGWRRLIQAYFEDIELKDPDATVTARIYNPCNLMMGLYRLAKLDTGDLLPSAEILVSSKEGSPLRIVLGAMVWNGKRVTDITEVLPEDAPTLFDLFVAGTLDGGPWAAEEHLIAQHGLSYVLVECTESPDGIVMDQLVIDDGVMRRLQLNERGLQDFGAFYAAHQDYLRALVSDFDSWARFE
jgi:hypothetical protein